MERRAIPPGARPREARVWISAPFRLKTDMSQSKLRAMEWIGLPFQHAALVFGGDDSFQGIW